MRVTLAPPSNARVARPENAKSWARPFTARLLEPGLVSYEDQNCGLALLRKETIDRFVNTFIGRPVTCAKNPRGKLVHQRMTPANMKEEGHGYISDVFYNASDGWWYARGVVDTDEAAQEIQRVGFCSVCYTVTQNGSGGVWHDMRYNDEILGFTGEHLAIVGKPRYEDATIRLENSKKEKTTMSLFSWKKKPAAAPVVAGDLAAVAASTEKKTTEGASLENAKGEDITGETVLTIPAGEGKTADVTLAQLVEVYNAKQNGPASMAADDEVVCNGKTYKMNALIEAFDKWERKNAAEEEEAKAKKEKENASGRRSHFNVLLNAAAAAPAPLVRGDMNTPAERLKRGEMEFGSAGLKK